MSEPFSRAERRQLKREKRKIHSLEQRSSARSFRVIAIIVGLLIVVAIPALWYATRTPELPNNEVKVAAMKGEHTGSTDGVVYNSNPPTSGPHFPDWHKDWKFYESELPVGGLIHNMEHGGVILWYKSSVDEATKAQLKEFTEDNHKMIASINDDITSQIALSAWGVYELFDTFDEAEFKRFYKKHLNRGPENVYP